MKMLIDEYVLIDSKIFYISKSNKSLLKVNNNPSNIWILATILLYEIK